MHNKVQCGVLFRVEWRIHLELKVSTAAGAAAAVSRSVGQGLSTCWECSAGPGWRLTSTINY